MEHPTIKSAKLLEDHVVWEATCKRCGAKHKFHADEDVPDPCCSDPCFDEPELAEANEMTNEEYLKAGGKLCPCCHSKEYAVAERNGAPRSAEYHKTCLTCGAEWFEFYGLTRYEMV